MRQGFRVYDFDTHVNPVAEILDQYVDPSFRAPLADLAPYRQQFGQAAQGSGQLQQYRVGTKYYRRILGTAGPSTDFTGRGSMRSAQCGMAHPGVSTGAEADVELWVVPQRG